MEAAEKLMVEFGDRESNDFNEFQHTVGRHSQNVGHFAHVQPKRKQFCNAVSWKNENAQPVIKKRERDGTPLL